MFDASLQWEAPPTEYYWIHNFLYMVYERGLIRELLGFQESSYVADGGEDGFHFYLDRAEKERMLSPSFSFYTNAKKASGLWQLIEEWALRVRAMPWTVLPLSSLDDQFDRLVEMEDWFQQTVALHLCTQPHLLKSLENEFRKMTGDLALTDPMLFNEFVVPTKLPTVLREQLAWFQLVLALDADLQVQMAELNSHLVRWRYVTAGDGQKPMTLSYLIDRLRNDQEDLVGVARRLASLEEKANGTAEIRVRALAASKLSTAAADMCATLRDTAYYRFVTKEVWTKLWYLIEQMRTDLASSLGRETNTFTTEELRGSPPEDLAEQDRSSYLLAFGSGRHSLFYNGRDSEARQSFIPKQPWHEQSAISGDPGYPGIVIGKALVVGWDVDPQSMVDRVDEETILVVPQTTPAFIGLLTRCKGLVTDEGGIAGHASIISRELRIPSVVGTHHATQVFQTGDAVRLDASRGTVERL